MYNFIFMLMIHKSFINHNSSNAQLQISKAHFLSLGKRNGPYDQAAVIMIQFTYSTDTCHKLQLFKHSQNMCCSKKKRSK